MHLHGQLKGQLEETTAQSEYNSGAHSVGLEFVMSHFVLQDFFFCTLQENNTSSDNDFLEEDRGAWQRTRLGSLLSLIVFDDHSECECKTHSDMYRESPNNGQRDKLYHVVGCIYAKISHTSFVD